MVVTDLKFANRLLFVDGMVGNAKFTQYEASNRVFLVSLPPDNSYVATIMFYVLADCLVGQQLPT